MTFSLTDLFWLFIILAMLQPTLKQYLIAQQREKLIMQLEQSQDSRVILLVHRQETLGFLSFPIVRFIDIADAEKIIQVIQQTDDDTPIDLILHTPGGLVLASAQIARALLRHPAKVRVLVPHYAMSGGTLIALAADEIVMSEHAVLGPVDPVVGGYAAVSLLRAVEQKTPPNMDDETLILADQASMAVEQVANLVHELIADKFAAEAAKELAISLSTGQWTHDHGITVDNAKKLGLNISTALPADVLHLMTLYPQPVKLRPSVEYLPRKSKPFKK